jgi:hypothetical protein
MGVIKRYATEDYVDNKAVDINNTASSLVSAHNSATDAHVDIREQIDKKQT